MIRVRRGDDVDEVAVNHMASNGGVLYLYGDDGLVKLVAPGHWDVAEKVETELDDLDPLVQQSLAAEVDAVEGEFLGGRYEG